MPYIKKLVMKGFKSFPSETEIPFQNSMNVIVGPNGSGKSNITDAVCFVLGRLSIKSMRAAKSANLIFAGTKTHKPSSQASVKLVFDNSDKGFFLDNKEIEIERLVRTNGQSIYRINQETKTRQEVLELLAQAGIDPHGFNIVLQGEITDLVKASTEERRKIIEQVAGISVYEIRKQRSLHELEKTDEKLKEISAVLRERTAYLKNLEKERQQALKFKQLESQVKKYKASIINKKLQEKFREVKKIQENLDNLEIRKQKIRKELNLIQENITDSEHQIEEINKKIKSSTGIEQEKLYSQLTELRESLAGLEVHKQNSSRKLEEVLGRRERAEKDISEFEIQIKELRKKSPMQAQKKSQLDQKKRDFDELEQERRKFYTIKTKLESIKQRIEDKKIQLQKNNNETQFILKQIREESFKFNSKEQATSRLSELKKQLNASNLEQLEKAKLTLEKQFSVSEAELASLDKIKKQVSQLDICPLCKSKITEEHLKHVYQDCDEKIEYNQNLLIKTRNKLKSLDQEITSLKSSQELLKQEISDLEIQLVKLENLNQQTQVVKRLEQERKEVELALQTLEKEKKVHESLQDKFKDVEGKYEQTLLEIEEISARTEENIDLELELKERDLERTKLIIKQSHRDQEELVQDLKELEKEIEEKTSLLQELEQQEKMLQAKYRKLFDEREKLQEKIHAHNKESLQTQNELQMHESQINNLKVEKAKLDAESETLQVDLETYPEKQFIQTSLEILQDKLAKTEATLALIGSVNLRALEVYDEIKKEYDEVANKAAGLEKEKIEILKIIEEIDKKKKRTFLKTLKAVNELFSRNFSQLSSKGQVFLNIETPKPKESKETLESTENQEDIFAGGLGITVKVGQGKYFDVTSLSGGEQTLVSLSLLFAIQEYKPYCFYIFDEVDAALDKRNSERLASLIKRYMKTGQYIIVTHNDAIITESTLLYGVSMQDGLSKILSLEV